MWITDDAVLYYLPSRAAALVNQGDTSHVSYVSLQPLPAGMSLNPALGVISGVPTAAFPSQIVIFALQDQYSRLVQPLLVVNLTVLLHLYPKSTPLNPAAYVVPIVVGLALIALIWFYIRYSHRKLYHVFISYRSDTDALLAETLYEKLHHYFLSTGHRVRCVLGMIHLTYTLIPLHFQGFY